MSFPTMQQVESLGIKVGATVTNEGRNRWPKGVKCKVLELNDVGTVLVQNLQGGLTTWLLASDLYAC